MHEEISGTKISGAKTPEMSSIIMYTIGGLLLILAGLLLLYKKKKCGKEDIASS